MTVVPQEPSVARLSRLAALVRQEQQCDIQRYNSLVSPDSVTGVMHEGGVHYPVTLGRQEYSSLGNLTVSAHFDCVEESLDNDFEPGGSAIFFYLGDDRSFNRVGNQLYIERVESNRVVVRLPGQDLLAKLVEVQKKHILGLQLGVDNASYQVMLDALDEAQRSTNKQFVHLRETLIGTLTPAFSPRYSARSPWLNSSQNDAIQKVVDACEVAVVHGPPGTGKTTTMVEAIVETLRRQTQVLVCAPSNAAVDWISEQLSRCGLNVLRVGNPLRINDDMLACSYENRYANHPLYGELWSIRNLLRAPDAHSGSGSRKAHLEKLRRRQMELEIAIDRDIFDQASVVACTLIGSANKVMSHRHFSTLFIDEAAQALEPACWAAILKADRVVLCGDHQQLPPTVKSAEAVKGGLSKTLMQHLVLQKPCCVTLLDTQYRMNRDIMLFSSSYFYGGNLKAAPEVADRLVSPIDTPLLWVDTSALESGEHQNARTASRSNAEEARLAVQTLRNYINMMGLQRFVDERIDIGIISPYRAQARLLRRMIRSQRMLAPLRRQIAVQTVDGFQGQERDVILISTVRANDNGQIGFLRDLRRMNVAITRAKMKLIIVGNVDTLSHHQFYSKLINHFRTFGQIVELQPEAQPNPDHS